MSAPGERIAVTGVGLTTALGLDAPTTFDRLIRGERGLSDVTLFSVDGQRTTRAGQVHDLDTVEIVLPGCENA